MTAAHEAVLRLLYNSLGHVDDVVMRRGATAPGEAGDIEFPSRTITVDHGLDFNEWVHTTAHELTHLNRGAPWEDELEQEERIVAEETARVLVPPEALPAILEAAKPAVIAAELKVDEPTVKLALRLAYEDRDAAAREYANSEEGIA
ncbi:hypothetical protein AB0425_17905 [Actinosynnema sp. NPDC051121]